MYKRITINCFASLLTLLGAVSVTSCNTEAEQVISEAQAPVIELQIAAKAGTRAGGKSDYVGEEWKMNTVDLFFYASDANEDTAAPLFVWHGDPKADLKGELKLTVQIPPELIETSGGSGPTPLFGSANKCKVYTVINAPEVTKLVTETIKTDYAKGPTINGLRDMKASTTSFSTKGKLVDFIMFTEESPADTNANIVTYDPASRKATGRLAVNALAAKIDIFVKFPDSVNDGGEAWEVYDPAGDGSGDDAGTVEAYIVNGVQAVRLGGWNGSEFLAAEDYFDLRRTNLEYKDDISRHLAGEKYNNSDDDSDPYNGYYYTAHPLYSYPNEWTTSVGDNGRTTLMLKVNWVPKGATDTDDMRETYYMIPVNMLSEDDAHRNKLVSNTYYRVKVNINTLGGSDFGEPLELECSWEVLDWGSAELDADIMAPRYIDISQKVYDIVDDYNYTAVMNNVNSVTIPYQSSHKIVLTKVEFYYYIFTEKGSDNSYKPVETNILRYRTAANSWNPDTSGYTNAFYDYFDHTVFTLDDNKLLAYADEEDPVNQEPQGVYIDELNSTITFYHSPYCLRGDGSKKRYFRAGIKNYSPYYIKLTFQHENHPEMEETVEIKQYPAIYVSFDANSGKTRSKSSGNIVPLGYRVSAGNYGGDNQERLGVYVNGGATKTWATNSTGEFNANVGSNCLQLGGIGGTGLPSNRNMYVIHVTQLSEDEEMQLNFYDKRGRDGVENVKFHIGDPRNRNVNNSLDGDGDLNDTEVIGGWTATGYTATSESSRNNFRKLPATREQGGAQRLYHTGESTLRYYYPTAEGQSEEHAFMVAPVFRLASGNTELFQGRVYLSLDSDSRTTDNLSRANARRRCAALQDNGYPAGRWRVPTVGEMYFFKMLYKKGILPDLFPNTRAYWTAQYLAKFEFEDGDDNRSKQMRDIRPYPNDDLPSHKFVRCVYDDWYWVRQDDKDKDKWVPDNIQSYSVKQIFNGVDYYWEFKPGSKLEMISGYYTDGDTREMFVWGDKFKNNPQDQPQDGN